MFLILSKSWMLIMLLLEGSKKSLPSFFGSEKNYWSNMT